MPDSRPDPRVYFAAERTMLAWLRTGIAVMAFGFVVARFGLFLRLLPGQGNRGPSHGLSQFLGAALVGLGIVATAGGAWQYRCFVARLPPADRPSTSSPRLTLILAWALVVIGLVLGVVLVVP
jgi:putative membrane protein